MDLSNLLSALAQGSDTSSLISALNQGSEAATPPGTLPALVPGTTPPGTTPPGTTPPGTTPPGTTPPGTFPNTPASLTPSLLNPGGVTSAPGASNPGISTGAPDTPFNPGTAGAPSQTGPNVPVLQRVEPPLTPSPAAGASAGVYYDSSAPASPSLLAQSGVSAYIQLLNALATGEQSDKSANQLTSNLGSASTTLKSSYLEAVSSLPAALQGKDWGFSVANGKLVFVQGQDELSVQDFADLQQAFAGSKVETAATQVAAAILSIELRQKAGADDSSLAWGRFAADESNFSDVVNLRAYVTATVPGGRYNPNVTEPTTNPQIPNMLGGMDLRDLLSARPNFFHADGSARTDALDAFEAPPKIDEIATLHGQCSCGEVRFSVEDAFEYAFYCHCSRCRLRTGSAFAAIAGIAIEKIQVTVGREHLLLEGECSDGYGARCNRCHAFLFAAVRGRQYMHISLGTLVSTPSRAPDHHIYVGSKAPWFQITDALPQYEELP